MVQEYLLQRCRYLAGSLKPFIYLLPRETTRIDYLIDNYQCEVRQIIYTDCIRIGGFKTTLSVTESVDNRLDFSTNVSISLRENWGEDWIELISTLIKKNCYVVVEDYNGIQYIQSPEFISDFTYTYDFNSDTQGHIAQLTYKCDCNMPVIILDTNITPTETYDNDCSYHNGDIIEFRMSPYNYVLIDNDVDTGEFSTITCTGGESMHKIEFTKDSFHFTQTYDGNNYQETLVFRIPLSDYKYYFRYNLVEFKENRYAVCFKTACGNWIASGFEFGFQPTYTIETSESVEELNLIEITLHHVGQNSIFYCEGNPIFEDSITEIYVPVTRNIKDPITGLDLQYWHCISKTEAIYTLIQMVTLSGVPTDNYLCLEGYEEYYQNLNIINTYEATDTFDFELTFTNSDCAIMDNCKFIKMTKEVYTFRSIGDYYDVHIQNPCNWTLNNIPLWITATRLSGDGGIDYVVRFTSKQNAGDNRIVSYSTLQSVDNVSTIQFILEKNTGWVNPLEHHINAMNQSVVSYVDADYDDYNVCMIGYGIGTIEKMPDTSSIRIYIPENTDPENTRTFQLKLCNTKTGDDATIKIYQDHIYVRWVEDINNFICVNGASYKKEIKYKGYTPDNINIVTEETRIGAQLISDDYNCQFDDGETMYRWNTNTGQTICSNGDKYAREDYEVSYDGGSTWTSTGEYRIGALIEASSPDCAVVQYKWEVDDTRWECVGTTSYYIEVKYESTDGVNWIKTDPEETQISQTIRLQNDEDCGYSEITYRWVDDGNNYICVDEEPQPAVLTRWVDMPYSVYNCVSTDKYSVEKEQRSTDNGSTWTDTGNTRTGQTLIEQNSVDCGYVGPTEEWRVEDNSYICENGSKYRSEIRYYWDGTWTTDGERRKGTLIEASSTDCVGTTNGKMYLFDVCTGSFDCINNVKIFKSTRSVNNDLQGLVWTQDSTSCSIDTRGVTPQSCGNYQNEYLTFVALEDGTFSFSRSNVNYSLDDGSTWQTLPSGSSTPTVTTGNKIMWKGTFTPVTNSGIGTFNSSGRYNVQGNVMSMIYGDNFTNQTNLTGKNYAFFELFKNNSKLINANNLSLPATTLAYRCYNSMFSGCTSLVNAPSILPATTLAEYCYYTMFYGCTSLVNAPTLPATTLTNQCYYAMFRDCTSLETAPALPATTLESSCYAEMFRGCESLTTAPTLSATTLAYHCYAYMFSGCESLTTAPALPATTLASHCYEGMFHSCYSLRTAPDLPATTSVEECYYFMFRDCTSLNYIKAMLTDGGGRGYTTNWVQGVSATGTFVKNSSASWLNGVDGIPSGWTVQTASS